MKQRLVCLLTHDQNVWSGEVICTSVLRGAVVGRQILPNPLQSVAASVGLCVNHLRLVQTKAADESLHSLHRHGSLL